MSGQLKRKRKKKNVAGRKPPQFAVAIDTILQDCTMTLEEMTAEGTAPALDEQGRVIANNDLLSDGCTLVDSLNGTWAFKDERLFRHLDIIRLVLNEFGDEYFTEEGASITRLLRDKKNRTWDPSGGQLVCGLCYLAIGMDFAEWVHPRSEWESLQDGMPYVKFKESIKTGDLDGESN